MFVWFFNCLGLHRRHFGGGGCRGLAPPQKTRIPPFLRVRLIEFVCRELLLQLIVNIHAKYSIYRLKISTDTDETAFYVWNALYSVYEYPQRRSILRPFAGQAYTAGTRFNLVYGAQSHYCTYSVYSSCAKLFESFEFRKKKRWKILTRLTRPGTSLHIRFAWIHFPGIARINTA